MSTPVLAQPVQVLQGAPYQPLDPILVEVDGSWQECVVDGVAEAEKYRFGLRWTVLAIVLETQEAVWATCDDNGRNHTWRRQVMPSNRLGS